MKQSLMKIIRIVLFLVFLGIFLFSGWKLWGIYKDYAHGIAAYEEISEQFVNEEKETAKSSGDPKHSPDIISEEPEPGISVDFASLKEKYPNVKGWLYCPGTPINYPIAQSEDNEYYLHRLLSGEYDKGGTLFMDCRNQEDFSDWNTLIYGHNMKNDTMFGVIPDYMEQKFFDEHPVMYLLTEDCTYEIRLIGGYVTPADAEIYMIPKTVEERDQLINSVSRASSFDSDPEIGNEEKLITLSTCVYDYENSRYVLAGALHKMEESAE